MNGAGQANKKIFLALDIGTSYIKCAAVDSKRKIISRFQCDFPMTVKDGTVEIDFDHFLNSALDLLSKCIADVKADAQIIEALLITSQAQTFAPVDSNFKPLYPGIVWLDERAAEEAKILKEMLPDFNKMAGFNQPLPALYVSKLLWLKRHEKKMFNRAAAFPLINEYLFYNLTGKFYTDLTTFGMGGMYDFRNNTLNNEILNILELPEHSFPAIIEAAGKEEIVKNHILQSWGLDYSFPIFLCGNDQGASACGAGLKYSGDININFGTAMVFYTLTDSLVSQLSDSQIAGKHPLGGYYFLLNYESDAGAQIRRLKDKYFPEETYDRFFENYYLYPHADVENPLFNAADYPDFNSPDKAGEFCAGIIRYYLQRMNTHFEQIHRASAINRITVSGGFTKSKIWLEILRDVLKKPVIVNNTQDAGLLGAVMIYEGRF